THATDSSVAERSSYSAAETNTLSPDVNGGCIRDGRSRARSGRRVACNIQIIAAGSPRDESVRLADTAGRTLSRRPKPFTWQRVAPLSVAAATVPPVSRAAD